MAKKKFVQVSTHMDEKACNYWNLDKNHLYEYVNEFFFNGEGHYTLIDKDGKKKTWPDVFFTEPK
jgi:hypothetical protein